MPHASSLIDLFEIGKVGVVHRNLSDDARNSPKSEANVSDKIVGVVSNFGQICLEILRGSPAENKRFRQQ